MSRRDPIILLITVVVLFFCIMGTAFYMLSVQDRRHEEEWKKLRIVLVTKQGVPVKYHGHTILYEGAHSSRNFVIMLSIDGKKIILDPGEELEAYFSDERGWGFESWRGDNELSRYAFYLPDGEKLRLKAVSYDLTELYWAKAN